MREFAAGGSLLDSIPSLVSGSVGYIPAQVGPDAQLTSAPAGSVRVLPQAAPPVNWTPILLAAGLVILISVFLRRTSKR